MNNGFSLLLKPSLNYAKYLNSNFARMNLGEIEKLRSFFPNNNPNNYKGISRNPFTSFPYYYDNKIRIYPDINKEEYDNIEARILFCQKSLLLSFDEKDLDLLDSENSIMSVYNLITNKEDYEPTFCFLAEQNDTYIGNLLGYDIGYWGGDSYSIICDSIIAPLWHPPHESDWLELKQAVNFLNENQLFNKIEDAIEFRCFYKSREWAEKENYNGQFCIVGICKLSEK